MRLGDRSRMSREVHVRFWESARVRFPRATHLHQLTTGRVLGTWPMAGRELLRRAHVEDQGRSRIILQPACQRLRINRFNPMSAGHRLRTGLGPGQSGWSGRGRHPGFAVGQLKARQLPAHGAVLECIDRVAQPGVDQGLRADDAARAAGAIDDDDRVLVGHLVMHAIDEFGARTVDTARYAHAPEFIERSGVEDDQLVATRLHRLDLGGGQSRRLIPMFDKLAKGLGRYIDAGVDLEAGLLPGARAAREHADHGIARCLQHAGRRLDEMVIIGRARGQDNRDRPARQPRAHQQFETAGRNAAGMKQVPGRECSLLAHVDQRNFLIGGQQIAQGLRADPVHRRQGRTGIVMAGRVCHAAAGRSRIPLLAGKCAQSPSVSR